VPQHFQQQQQQQQPLIKGATWHLLARPGSAAADTGATGAAATKTAPNAAAATTAPALEGCPATSHSNCQAAPSSSRSTGHEGSSIRGGNSANTEACGCSNTSCGQACTPASLQNSPCCHYTSHIPIHTAAAQLPPSPPLPRAALSVSVSCPPARPALMLVGMNCATA
jgi:hypothetical protein